MRFRTSSYAWLFRLSSFIGEQCVSASPLRFLVRPTFYGGVHLFLGRKLTMQSGRNANHSNSGANVLDRAEKTGPGLVSSNISSHTLSSQGVCPSAGRMPVVTSLLVSERYLRTPSPQLDDDSEAESFRDGRSEEVDRDTKSRAFLWCRDFLSGSWKTVQEADFQISIVR